MFHDFIEVIQNKNVLGFVIVAVALFMCSASLYAQVDPARQLVRTLSAGDDVEGIYQKAATAFANRMQPAIQSKIKRLMTDDEKERLAQFWHTKIVEWMPISALEDILVADLNKNLNSDEIDELNTFYRSDLGKKLLMLSPILKKEARDAVTELARKAAGKDNIEKIGNDLKKEFPEWFDASKPGA